MKSELFGWVKKSYTQLITSQWSLEGYDGSTRPELNSLKVFMQNLFEICLVMWQMKENDEHKRRQI